MFDQIAKCCNFLLNNYPQAFQTLEYLDSRLNKESQEKFQFGYFPNLDNLPALTTLIDEEILLDNKLLFQRQISDSLYPRIIKSVYFKDYPLIMPIKNVYGKTIALVGRTILDEETRQNNKISKYKYTIDFEKSENLFGLFENKANILDKSCVYIVEGQLDVIKATERNFNNIVAIGGSSMSAVQFSLITRYTDTIFLLLDNDDAGRKGRDSIISNFGKYANIQNFYLPLEYKDIDEYFSKNDGNDIELMS